MFFLLIPFFIFAESISYYQGYLLYENYVKNSVHATDFDQLVEGIKAAHRGLVLNRDDIEKKQKEHCRFVKQERLANANRFMAAITGENGVIVLVKGKLAYKVIKQGTGSEVQENDSPSIKYTAKILEGDKEVEFGPNSEEPKEILLKSTISGFMQGVVGMREGEKRILYIHPDLAYGSGSELIEPNSQMIFEVEVFKKSPIKEG